MELFIKAIACALVTSVVYLILSKRDKDFALLVAIAACCIVLGIALNYLQSVLGFLKDLQELSQLDNEMLEILIKSAGIGLLAQIAGLICSDAGNASLSKTLQYLASAFILWLSIPLFRGLLDLISELLVGI